MLPNWIIAGVPKAATSSVFRWLRDHPETDASIEKETYYFVDPGTHMFRRERNFHRSGLPGYKELFAQCAASAPVILESTPGYFYSRTAVKELPRLPSKPDFIFILREPVQQLKSLFTYFRGNWNWIPQDMNFRDFIAAVDGGTEGFRGNELAALATKNAHYVEPLQRWRRACGGDRMHIYLFDEILQDKRQFMRDLAQKMCINPAFYDGYAFPSENVSYAVRSQLLQNMNIRVRAKLPKGQLYRAMRHAYRSVNTSPDAKSSTHDPETERRLTRRYLEVTDRLETEWGLDMSPWRRTQSLRLSGHDVLANPTGGAMTAHRNRPAKPLNARGNTASNLGAGKE